MSFNGGLSLLNMGRNGVDGVGRRTMVFMERGFGYEFVKGCPYFLILPPRFTMEKGSSFDWMLGVEVISRLG